MAEKLKQGDSLAKEIFDKFNGLVDDVNEMKNSASGGGTGGGGDAIIDVTSLPENPNPKVLYRLETAVKRDVYSIMDGEKNVIQGNTVGWEVVDELPEEGIGILAHPDVAVFMYFSMSDKQAYGYYSGMWLTVAVLMSNLLGIPLEYAEAMMGGSFSSDNMPELDPSKIYFIYTVGEPSYSLYQYKGKWMYVDALPPTIIDVTDLPTENIRENVFYRTPAKYKFYCIQNQYKNRIFTIHNTLAQLRPVECIVVSELPEKGKPMLDATTGNWSFYFCEKDKLVYGYGWQGNEWQTTEEVFGAELYGGIYNINELFGVTLPTNRIGFIYTPPAENKYEIYYYKNGWHSLIKDKITKITVKSIEELPYVLDDSVISVDYYGFISGERHFKTYPINATNEVLHFECSKGMLGVANEERTEAVDKQVYKCKYIDETICCTIGFINEGVQFSYIWMHGYSFNESQSFDLTKDYITFNPHFIIVTKRG